MPRDSGGIYTLPSGYKAETGQDILASQHNPPLEDLAAAMTGSLPRNGSAPMQADLPMGNHKITGLTPGTASTDAATTGQVQAAAPTGAVMLYAGTTAPGGWLICDGRAISRTEFAALFAAIGGTYGAGNGSTTFNIPDCRGRVIAGVDGGAGRLTGPVVGSVGGTLGAVGGEQAHVVSAAEMPAHQHSGSTDVQGNHAHSSFGPWRPGGGSPFINHDSSNDGDAGVHESVMTAATGVAGAHAHNFVTSVAGSNWPHNNVQPTIVLNTIIKV